MIRWVGERLGRKLIGFGLEEGNLQRLREGKPIYVYGEEMGLPFDITIYYGKDMQMLMEMTKPGLKPDSVIQDHRERKKQ